MVRTDEGREAMKKYVADLEEARKKAESEASKAATSAEPVVEPPAELPEGEAPKLTLLPRVEGGANE
jgi:hypothetical protein